MAFIKRIEFGNYTCTFGDRFVLLDLFDEVVWPSFMEMAQIRKSRDSEYFFVDTMLTEVDIPGYGKKLCISGRFVKNAKLKRDQIFRVDEGVIEDHDELETAPSSLFLLVLESHRLIFVREVAGAPSLDAFKATSARFLRSQHKRFIEQAHSDSKKCSDQDDDYKKLTKKALIEQYPYPHLRITPLTDSPGLRDFVNKFKKIDELSIKLLPTNKEDIDNDDFWNELNDKREKIGSNKAAVHFSNKKEGLSDNEVYEQCSSATSLGNSEINIKGQDNLGDSLAGSNEDFQLKVELVDLTKDVEKSAKPLLGAFMHLVKAGAVTAPIVADIAKAKVADIVSRLL